MNSITTERLTLRPLNVDDSEFIRELVNTDQWLKNIGERNVHSENAAVVYVQKILANATVKYWVMELKDAKIPIGIITLLKRDYLEHWDLGFALLPSYNSRGFAFEGSKAILDFLSKESTENAVMAITIPENESSIKLLLRLGFKLDKGLLRDGEELSLYTKSF